MPFEVLKVLVVVQGMVPDRVVFLRTRMQYSRAFMREPRHIHPKSFAIQRFHVPDHQGGS